MKHRFEVLDIFRGLFASFVFLFHLSPFAQTWIINNNFVYNSDMFVDFFFVLSGFVIAYSYENLINQQQVFVFFKKRFLRIYPLHLVMLLVFVIVEVFKHLLASRIHVNSMGGTNNIYTFISSLLLLNSAPVFHVKDVSWNIPSWSISAEMIAYIVFGFVILFIHKSNIYRFRAWIYILIAGLAAGSLICINRNFELNYSFDYGFIRGVLGFFAGLLCFNAFKSSREYMISLPSAVFSFAEAIALILVILSIFNGFLLKPIGLVFELVFFICIYIFSFEKGIISKALKKIPILQRVGKYSYSIYMTHALLISLFNVLFIRLLKFPPSAYAYLFIVNYLLIYFVSAWTYKHIELKFYHSAKGVKKQEETPSEQVAVQEGVNPQ